MITFKETPQFLSPSESFKLRKIFKRSKMICGFSLLGNHLNLTLRLCQIGLIKN